MVSREVLLSMGLVARMLVRPMQALRGLDERARGGTLAVALLVFVAIPLSRASNVIPRVWDTDRLSAAIERVFWTMVTEAGITAGAIVGILWILQARVERGRHRSRRDIQLAAACCLPALCVRLLAGLPQLSLRPPWLAQSLWLVIELVWTVAMAELLVRLARARDPDVRYAWAEELAARRAPSPAPRRADAVAAVGVLVAALGAGAVDVGRNVRPAVLAPAFTLARLNGPKGSVDLKSLRGKTVVLDFWASWCGPCRAMFPRLERAQQRWKDRGVVFVGIACDDEDTSESDLASFITQMGITYPTVRGTRPVMSAYRIEAFPTLFVVRPDGVLDGLMNVASEESLDEAIAHAAGH